MNNNIPDKSVQLIIADPPYFQVKGDFDFIWDSFDDYLKDVERWAVECKRILADNGTLFWWGNSKKIAYSQIILDRYFCLENSIVWEKIDSIQMSLWSVDLNRSFTTHNERLLMFANDYDKTGNEIIFEQFLKPQNPFSIYLKDEFKRSKVTIREVAKLFPSKTGGLTGCVSNWLNGDNVITEEQYLKIRDYLFGDYLKKEYEELKKEYEELKKEYEDKRRCFDNFLRLTEMFKFSQEGRVSVQYNHDTIKPEKLTAAIVNTCSRKNDLVLIPFVGSGTEIVICDRYDRKYIGYEIVEKYYKIAEKRLKEEQMQMRLDL